MDFFENINKLASNKLDDVVFLLCFVTLFNLGVHLVRFSTTLSPSLRIYHKFQHLKSIQNSSLYPSELEAELVSLEEGKSHSKITLSQANNVEELYFNLK